jgi:pimeloyl-ACP methyl ester carboxylesterase
MATFCLIHGSGQNASAWQLLETEVSAWALTTRVDWYPEGLYEEPCPLLEWPDIPSAYVLCSQDRTIRPEWSRRAARERLGVEAIELPGGHCPHISRPGELAGLFVSLT